MAFLRRVLEHQPVYYLGTDTGQVWRGSPEVGWTKLCECGAAPVNAIGPDLFRNERIFVVLKGPTSPGRIKELDRLANGTWQSKTIDAGFAPDVDVEQCSAWRSIRRYRRRKVPPFMLAPTKASTAGMWMSSSSIRRLLHWLTYRRFWAIGLGAAHRACPTCRSQTSRCNKTFRLMTRADRTRRNLRSWGFRA